MILQNPLIKSIYNKKKTGNKSFAVLIDPDKTDEKECLRIIEKSVDKVDYFFVGGSLITGDKLSDIVFFLKEHSNIPVVLFPGSSLHITPGADAILFLSLISGRNPDLLIGQHVIAAPLIKKSKIEVLPTGYILIDGGKPTTVSYMSNTFPIPADKPEVAACTALAGELLGLQLIYLDAGSGALQSVSPEMIKGVKKIISLPIIVGGGINSPEKALKAWEAGADVIVIGNAIESNPDLIDEITFCKEKLNSKISDPIKELI